MTTRAVTFDDFRGGEWGDLGARNARPDQFAALNMLLYRTGLLGPRPGVRPLALTGVTANPLKGFGWHGTPGADLWWCIGTAIQTADSSSYGSAAATASGALASTPTEPLASVEVAGGYTYLTSRDDKTYRLLHTGSPAVSAIASSPGGRCIGIYGQRMVVGGTGAATEQRLRYSDADDYTTWDAANYFDVGDAVSLVYAAPQRLHLALGKADGTWWVVTGTLGSTNVLRRIAGGSRHPWHGWGTFAALQGDDRICFVPVGADHPAYFAGATIEELDHLKFTDGTAMANAATHLRAVKMKRPDEALILSGLSGQRMMQHRNGIWTFHELSSVTGGAAAWACGDGQGRVFIANPGSAGVAPTFHVYDTDLDRPGFTADTNARPGDGSDTPLSAQVSFPEWWDRDGREVTVRGVEVHFRKWQTGSGTDNAFTVTVDALRRYGGAATLSSGSQTWSEAGASASTSGTDTRATFQFGEQGPAHGFQVRLTAVKGVAIRSVTAIVDVGERRGG